MKCKKCEEWEEENISLKSKIKKLEDEAAILKTSDLKLQEEIDALKLMVNKLESEISKPEKKETYIAVEEEITEIREEIEVSHT